MSKHSPMGSPRRKGVDQAEKQREEAPPAGTVADESMRQKTGTAEGAPPPELVAPGPPVAPDAAPLEEAQAARPSIAAPVRPRAVPLAGAVPTGPVRVRPPWGGTFNLDWHNITR
jgi:hypothetical protein